MSLPKIHNSIKKPCVRSVKRNTTYAKKPQGELDLKFDHGTTICADEPVDFVREFLRNLRQMCQLIEEAGRYGATSAMENKYRKLRTTLAKGYQLVKEESGVDLFPSAGFHGGSFEMIFTSYSLDGLVRGPGLRTVERLAEIWRTAQTAKLPDERFSNSRS